MNLRAPVVALFGLILLAMAPASAAADVFQVHVIDSLTGRGVPLVEMTPQGGPTLLTDSNGIIALDDSSLLNRSLHLGFRSYGYSEWGGTMQTTAGGNVEIAIERRNRAERLYRVTGPGIYEDSVQVGASVPIAKPLHNANVRGQDSVQAAVYKNQIHWFFGDTLYEAGFGNFRTSGARSALPGQGGLDPSAGVDLNYFIDAGGSSRQMMPLSDPGPVWVDGLFTIPDAFGTERLLTHFSRMDPDPNHLFEVLEHGLALFNDSTQTFQRFQPYSLNAPIVPRGHAFRHTDNGEDYVYFAEDYPNVRVKADWTHVADVTKWEAFTPLLENTRFDGANPPLETDAQGELVFGWKKGADPFSASMLDDLVQRGHLDRDDSPFRLEDHATGRDVRLHRASVHWNEYRRNWIMIGTELFGDSLLGEVWFSEAPTPEGPWEDAVKIATHDRGTSGDYSFYNPASHPFLDQEGGRFVYFQGTYANTFSGNPAQTPLYDYNQMMYRLDLSTIPQLTPLRGDYDGDSDVDGADLLAWQQTLGLAVAPFSGADGDGSGVIDASDLGVWKQRYGADARPPGAVPRNVVADPDHPRDRERHADGRAQAEVLRERRDPEHGDQARTRREPRGDREVRRGAQGQQRGRAERLQGAEPVPRRGCHRGRTEHGAGRLQGRAGRRRDPDRRRRRRTPGDRWILRGPRGRDVLQLRPGPPAPRRRHRTSAVGQSGRLVRPAAEVPGQ